MAEKRVHAVKVLLSDSEAAALYQQSLLEDRKPADMLRKGWLLHTFGSLGLARDRAQRNRGEGAELTVHDFTDTGIDLGSMP